MNKFPPQPQSIPIKIVLNFFENSQGAPPVSLTLVIVMQKFKKYKGTESTRGRQSAYKGRESNS